MSTRTELEVAPVTAERVEPVATAIARGFHDNEAWEWVVPSERRRARFLRAYYSMMIRRAVLPRGEAWTTADQKAGALWFPPHTPPHVLGWEQLHEAAVMLRVGIRGIVRGMRADASMKEHHPREPHYYLQTLAVDPDYQRRGYGGVLMAPMLEAADAERMPSYLETQRESNVPYYRRFGFELTRRIEIRGGGPPLWLMWREPGR